MKENIADVIADLVRTEYSGLDQRFRDQADALREFECTHPVIGRWIDENDVEYLLSAFALNDRDFAARFPDIKNITRHERIQMIDTFHRHFDECTRCSRKRSYDLELNRRIDRVCRQNGKQLKKLLQDDAKNNSDESEHFAVTIAS